MVHWDLNFKQVIDNRYSGTRKVIKVKFYTILTWIVILLSITALLYYIAYTDITSLFGVINLNTDSFYTLKYYIYWIIFFNNILLPVSILYLYFLFIDNIDVLRFTWEKRNPFNDDESFNF